MVWLAHVSSLVSVPPRSLCKPLLKVSYFRPGGRLARPSGYLLILRSSRRQGSLRASGCGLRIAKLWTGCSVLWAAGSVPQSRRSEPSDELQGWAARGEQRGRQTKAGMAEASKGFVDPSIARRSPAAAAGSSWAKAKVRSRGELHTG